MQLCDYTKYFKPYNARFAIFQSPPEDPVVTFLFMAQARRRVANASEVQEIVMNLSISLSEQFQGTEGMWISRCFVVRHFQIRDSVRSRCFG